ncbi:hypothetical protein [Rhodobium gokarnense]|uniref:SCP2 domain-containing protein n=1 Tax=Rhodobium gokarnense TaxID=364296 RepID=A0ABT3H7N1_9HYPH|nr:hypothetical protein [Rhodobium gokarnense]MCW2306344.1 hypothetical protein [Rhodobium gokarnense]
MQDVMLKLKDRLNGPDADTFANKYYGRVLTGNITLKYDEEVYTFAVHNGKIIDVTAGIPLSGVDLGVSGAKKDWDQFAVRKSLTVSTNKMNPNCLAHMGAPLRTRQNFNAVAYLCRVFAEILEGTK